MRKSTTFPESWLAAKRSVPVVAEGCDCGAHFVDDVREFFFWSEGEMARPRAGLHHGERRVVRSKRAFRGVEAVDQDLVEPEVGDDDVTVIGSQVHRVRVR